MAEERGAPRSPDELRRQAEDRLRHGTGSSKGTSPNEAEPTRLLQELEIHQLELEMQNDELRASRLEAEQAAARFAELHDFAPMGYATVAPDGTLRTLNFAAAELLGLERSRLRGKHLQAFVAPADREALSALLARALERSGVGKAACELSLMGVEAGRHHVLLTAAALARPEPEILVALQDVTARRQREEELQEVLRLLELSQRIARLGTLGIDVATGRWTSSPALDEILGIGPRYERSAASLAALVDPQDRERLVAYLLTGLKRGEPLDEELRLVNPLDGRVRWAWLRGDAEFDAMEPIRLVATLQDITERKRLQEERAQLLAAAQAARTEAEEANRSKDAFMATLSHELRNPLMPVSNSLFILERVEAGSEPARRALATIHRQVNHLARLVDDLLDTTRIARGKIQLRRQPLDLNDIARSAVEDHRSLFEAAGVRLELRPAPDPVRVDGDWHRLAQVAGNLLQNAAKFCERGGTTRLTVARDAAGGALLCLDDDGVGMDPAMLARLFQPFAQADSTLDRSKGGLGLGMALAKRLVELHGGTITARSAGLHQGAEFVVRLPLAPGEVTAPPAERPPAPAVASRRRVLVIEDNLDAAETLREILELDLHEVEVAHDGPEGLARARDFHPEIVLCDIGLPGMDGYEVARALRADPALADTYLVALSGYALATDLGRALGSGFDRHLTKPPTLVELDRVLAEGRPHRGDTGGAPPA